MNITAAINSASDALRDSGVEQPRRQAASLMAFVLEREASFLIANPEYQLSPPEIAAFESVVGRRVDREPYQYIVGKQEFYGLEFEVTPEVLIPRPETEILVEDAIDVLSVLPAARLFEIGVGSGCISVSILHAVAKATGMGIDISENALAVAKRNAARHSVTDRLTLQPGDLFEGITGQFDLIVSNPPYVSDEQLKRLQPEVRDFEPRTALSGGPGGLEIIERIIRDAPRSLAQDGHLLMEIGYDQSERVEQLFDAANWIDVKFLPDLQGIARIVRARLA
ncbi:MAG: peptide chain release factor N(5)-glutamine methyltransferase [Pyrinomonadaceae bacterium]